MTPLQSNELLTYGYLLMVYILSLSSEFSQKASRDHFKSSFSQNFLPSVLLRVVSKILIVFTRRVSWQGALFTDQSVNNLLLLYNSPTRLVLTIQYNSILNTAKAGESFGHTDLNGLKLRRTFDGKRSLGSSECLDWSTTSLGNFPQISFAIQIVILQTVSTNLIFFLS